MPIALDIATAFTETLRALLEPSVLRVEIAGSIRRGLPVVGDIDLVVLPRRGVPFLQKKEMVILENGVGEPEKVYLIGDLIFRPKNGGDCYVVMDAVETGFQVDMWVAREKSYDLAGEVPGNFGSILLCRTGSKEHNIRLVNRAKQLGLRWSPHLGVVDEKGQVLASETEKDIFDMLKLNFVEPQDRI